MSVSWIGTSGYVYPHWRRGVFYPAGLRQREELAWYAERFHTVELNNPFYRVPTAEVFDRWRLAVPDGFRFAVKANREITHFRRLKHCAEPVGQFLERASRLGDKLGPILFQLPPTLHSDPALLRSFLATLPRGPRWVVEFRHPSWQTTEIYDTLGGAGVALCVPVGGRVQPDLVTTADFSYLRMHTGSGPGGAFSTESLVPWVGRIRALTSCGKDGYVYFNNDRGGHAPRDARLLVDLLGTDR